MQRPTRLMLPLAAAVLAAGLFAVSPTNAQSPSPKPDAAQQTPNIPDEKLDQAAAAIMRVASLKDQYVQRLSEAEPAEKERIMDEAEDALERAVTEEGLSVEEYNSIVAIAQSNPEVLDRLRQRLPEDTE